MEWSEWGFSRLGSGVGELEVEVVLYGVEEVECWVVEVLRRI